MTYTEYLTLKYHKHIGYIITLTVIDKTFLIAKSEY